MENCDKTKKKQKRKLIEYCTKQKKMIKDISFA